MKAKEYLQQVKIFNDAINSELEDLAKIRELSFKATSALKEVCVIESKIGKSPMENSIVRIDEEEERINKLIDKYIDLKNEVKANINKIENENYRMVLDLKYIKFYKWDEIAKKMNLYERSVLNYHRFAIKELDEIIKWVIV